MVDLRPFRGILYNPSRVPDMSTVVCPPYDVISPDESDRYYALDAYNTIRLILGKEFPLDTEEENRYTRAARYFGTWLSQGVLLQDTRPSFYLLKEYFSDEQGRDRTRLGIIGLVHLLEYFSSSIRPHEATHEGPKKDRFRLLKATEANFCQIFSLYTDPSYTLDTVFDDSVKGPPRVEVVDHEGVRRLLYAATDPLVLARIQALFADKELMIADGHHRYETALAYRDWRRSQEGFNGSIRPYEYVMMYLTNTEGEGLSIFPTHRILTNYAPWKPERLLDALRELFDVHHFPGGSDPQSCRVFMETMKTRSDARPVIGMKCKAVQGYYLLTLKDERLVDAVLGTDLPPILRTLDVTILHAVILGHFLGIDPTTQEKNAHILYVKGAEKAVQLMEEDLLHQAVFFLSPPDISKVRDVVKSGGKMPQKSTFFYPKLLTGLVFRKMDALYDPE